MWLVDSDSNGAGDDATGETMLVVPVTRGATGRAAPAPADNGLAATIAIADSAAAEPDGRAPLLAPGLINTRPHGPTTRESLELAETTAPLDETLLDADADTRVAPVVPLPVERIGRYVVLKKLGEGGMGEVYSAYDEELDRRVAIKLVHNRLGGDSVGRARMQREAQAMARLSHPNVVQVHDVGNVDGQVFVAMEFVKGVTLGAWQRDLTPDDPADRRRILDMYIQAGNGLQAAHAHDLVHRDFKPDNVLVGADGRARVLDFGLAASQRDANLSRAPTGAHIALAGNAMLDSDLTRTGSVMGTPAYMAPEQFLADPTDARTDQFSFCVALYEALYGVLPFTGDTFMARQISVTDGAVRTPPANSRVPAWLRDVVLRGLARRPGDRHPDMGALLAALADDPELRRRRRLRRLGALALVSFVTVALIVGGMEAWARWQEHRAQENARQRLEQLDARLDALVAAGKIADARRVFRLFVEQPENRGTAAMGLAWLRHAERERTAGNERETVDAYATAYTIAASKREQAKALVGLAKFLREQHRWGPLGMAVTTIAKRAPAALADPDVQDLRFDAALGRRDLRAAVSLLDDMSAEEQRAHAGSIVRALSRATRTELTHVHQIVRDNSPAVDEARRELALTTRNGSKHALVVARTQPDLARVATIPRHVPGAQLLSTGAGAPPLYVERREPTRDESTSFGVVARRDGDTLTTLFEWPEDIVTTALSHDFDGDGALEQYIGTGPYSRHVVELVRRPGDGPASAETWGTRSPAPALDQRRSDVMALLAGDLDGDGRDELVAALGPWTAYELHVLRYDPETRGFSSVTRHKLGNILDATLIRRQADGLPEIALIKNDNYANDKVFPPDRPTGAPAGVYLFRLRGDSLEQTEFVSEPTLLDQIVKRRDRIYAADLDGDGAQELIATFETALRSSPSQVLRSSQIYWTDARGVLAPVALAYSVPAGVADLDGDGDDELLVTPTDDTESPLWVLGAGDDVLPPARANADVVAVDAPADREMTTMERRARDLVAMGLRDQAADAFATLADLSDDDDERGRALLEAASIREELKQDDAATALYERALGVASRTAAAAEGAARGHARLGDFDRAAATIDRALATESVGDDARARLQRERARLDPLTSGRAAYELRFERPLDPAWRIEQPLQLRRAPVEGALHVDTVQSGPIASLAISPPDDRVALEVDLEIRRGEWGGDLVLGLAEEEADGIAGAASPVGVRLAFSGGATDPIRLIHCFAWGAAFSTVNLPRVAEGVSGSPRLQARISWDPASEEATCRITDSDGQAVHYDRVHLPGQQREPRAGLTLQLRARGRRGALFSSLYRVTMLGVTPGERNGAAPRQPDQRARALLSEGDYVGVLRALDELALDERRPEHELWRVVALAELDRVEAAAAALTPLFAPDRLKDAGHKARVIALSHARPWSMAPVIRAAAGPALRTDLYIAAWNGAFATSPDNDEPTRVLHKVLADLESLSAPPRAMLDYLYVRANVYRRQRMDARARRDVEAQLAILRDPETQARPSDPEGWRATRRAGLEFELAVLAARSGELDTARGIIERLTRDGQDALKFADMAQAHPDLAPLRAREPAGPDAAPD